MKESFDSSTCHTQDQASKAKLDLSSADIQERARALYRGEALAPMVRASTTPLRTLALKYGADFVYTEELVDRAISGTERVVNDELDTIDYIKDTSTMGKKQLRRLEKVGGSPVLLRIDRSVERGRLVCQMGTGDATSAVAAALHVHKDVDAIDVNMGCPKKFSVSGGMGSALLSDPLRASEIIRTLRNQLPCPVSAKIRLLKDTSSTLDFCQTLIHAGVTAIAIHARRVGDESTNPADWGSLKDVVKLLKAKEPSIPVLVNGDFYTRREWMDFKNEMGVDGVLLARPALYNTSIFVKPNSSEIETSNFGYDSKLLLPKTAVVQDYLKEAIRYHTNYKNVKYVVCEMMNNRRSPVPRMRHLSYEFEGKQTIESVCKCSSLQELCKEWNVGETVKNAHVQQQGEHIYEDSYFFGKNAEPRKTQIGDQTQAKRARIEKSQSVETD